MPALDEVEQRCCGCLVLIRSGFRLSYFLLDFNPLFALNFSRSFERVTFSLRARKVTHKLASLVASGQHEGQANARRRLGCGSLGVEERRR
jgi:hypothetical protein